MWYLSAHSPPRAWDFICHTQIIDLHTGPTQHVRVLVSAELDHATLYAQGWVGGKFLIFGLDVVELLFGCFQAVRSILPEIYIYSLFKNIANLHRIRPIVSACMTALWR